MQATDSLRTLSFVQHLTMITYGINLGDADKHRSPLDYDEYDDWLGFDFDFYLKNLLDGYLSDIESDLLTVWSTNKSEQES